MAQQSPLLRLPLEIIDHIADYMASEDRLALALTARLAQALTEPSLYSSIRLTSPRQARSLKHIMYERPNLSRHVRELLLVNNTCYFHVDRFVLLQEMYIEGSLILRPMLQRLATSATLYRCLNLRRMPGVPIFFHLILPGPDVNSRAVRLSLSYTPKRERSGAFDDAMQQLILMGIFCMPALRIADICCRNVQGTERIFIVGPWDPPPPLHPENLGRSVLHHLSLRWDGLPLAWLRALLLPSTGTLESLELTWNLTYHHDPPYGQPSPPTLDEALEPAARSLSLLKVWTVNREVWDDGDEPDDPPTLEILMPHRLGLRWSPRGLSGFSNLRRLDISYTFFEEVHGFLPGTPWLPPSLVTLAFPDIQLVYLEIEPHLDPDPDDPDAPPSLTLEPHALNVLDLVASIADRLLNLRHVEIKWNEIDKRIITDRPPILWVRLASHALVDHGVAFSLQDQGHSFELGARVYMDNSTGYDYP